MDKLTVKELQRRCKEAGLKTTGKKQALVERLEFHSAHNTFDHHLAKRVRELETTIARLEARNVGDSEGDESNVEISRPNTSALVPQVVSSPRRVEPVVATSGVTWGANYMPMPAASTTQAPIDNNGPVQVSTTQSVSQSVPQYTYGGGVPQYVPTIHTPRYIHAGAMPQCAYPASIPVVQNSAMFVPHQLPMHYATASPFTNVKDIVAVLPEFDPMSDESLTSLQFVQRVQMLQNAYQWRDDLVIFAVQQKLKGHAKLWADSQCEFFTSWQHFSEKLAQAFPFEENAATAHIQMANAKREHNETPQRFYFRMMAMGTKFGVPENAIARHIINGVNDNDLRKKISNDYGPFSSTLRSNCLAFAYHFEFHHASISQCLSHS